jgi:glucose/arabinose dehydrogenase
VRRVAVLAVLAASLLFATSCGEPVLSVTTAVSNLDHPWDIGFLPDRTMLVTERAGRLSRIVDGHAELIVAPSDVVAIGEAGMLGLAVDPFFTSNGFVFVCMASSLGAGGAPDVRLVRFTLSQDGAQVLARNDVFTGLPFLDGSGRHSGCRPRFAPDGVLWVGTGDSATGTVPQDPLTFGGKVLRLRRSGRPVPSNPYGLPWYTRGHRNVQGLAFRKSDGLAVSVEQGTDRDDEVNVLRFAGNGGWDPVPGYDESRPMTDFTKFPDAMRPIWASGYPTMATSGATFLSGEQWGTWDGALVIGTLKGHHLQVLLINGDGVVTGQRQVVSDRGRLRQPVQGRDGNLYVTTDNGGGNDVILKITPSVADN